MSLSCTISQIERDIGRLSPFLTYPTSIWRPVGVTCRNFAEVFGVRKLESLAIVRHCLLDPAFSCSGRVPACDRRTNGRTDRRTHDDSIYRASI